MCDQNIAVSIRSLNQMSSIIPNSMEKLKLASLSAGIVAGFTTDCFYDADTSLSKGYDATVSDRVNGLGNVLKNYIVLNKSWYDSGARTISDMRNIFITGRKHPLNTLNNVFSVITRIEFNQNNMDNGVKINVAKNILMHYGLSLETPFHRLLTTTRDKGLLVALTGFREDIIKNAKRINTEGVRLDILDESKISTIVSVVGGLIIGYAEPLPSTSVDFNEYYATTAYPFAASLANELVEKLTIDTDSLFAAYRSTIEARYELTFEPVATVRGLLSILTTNDILSKNMSEAIVNSNKEELIEYIVGMVKGVYDVRKEHAERSVLHELDYLPINTPLYELFNKPESNEDIQKRMSELTASIESILATDYNIDVRTLRKFRTVSIERLSARQMTGIAMIVLGGALMAWAVYITFFSKTASLAKNTHDFHKESAERIAKMNKQMAQLDLAGRAAGAAMDKNLASVEKALMESNRLLHSNIKDAAVAKKTANTVVDQINKGAKVEEIKMPEVKYTLNVGDGVPVPDLSRGPITDQLNTYAHYHRALSINELEEYILPEKFKAIKSVDAFDKYIGSSKNSIQVAGKKYRPRPLENLTGKVITQKQLLDYIDVNLLSPHVSERLEKIAKYAEDNVNRTSKIDYEARSKEYEEIIKAAIPDISDADFKECLESIRDLNKEIQKMYRTMGEAFIAFQKSILAWDKLAVTHMTTINIITEAFKTDPKTGAIQI